MGKIITVVYSTLAAIGLASVVSLNVPMLDPTLFGASFLLCFTVLLGLMYTDSQSDLD